jgi:hypothetical protein
MNYYNWRPCGLGGGNLYFSSFLINII